MLYQLYLDCNRAGDVLRYWGLKATAFCCFHDCTRLLEKFFAFLLRLPVSRSYLVLLGFFLAAEDCAYPRQTLKSKFWRTVM